MKYTILLVGFINKLCIECSLLSNGNVTNYYRDEATVAKDIIYNYLYNFVRKEFSFLSIVPSSSNVEQQYFQEKIITMVMNSKLDSFSYDIQNKVKQSREGNTNAFNLILLDQDTSIG